MGVLYARVAGAWVPVGGGSGADEVHVGPDQPADTLELWVDTDETAPLPDDSRWNTAWGVVAVGSLSVGANASLPAATNTQVTNNLAYTTVTGRRYRVVFRARAVQASANTAANVTLRDGTTNLFGTTPVPYIPMSTYNVMAYDWLLVGDGVARSFNISINPAQNAAI